MGTATSAVATAASAATNHGLARSNAAPYAICPAGVARLPNIIASPITLPVSSSGVSICRYDVMRIDAAMQHTITQR